MGVLDALTILGAGVGRGYRGSQEAQRQMAESKRKALLEEREQAVREQTAQTQKLFQEAQVKHMAVQTAIGDFDLDVNKKNFERNKTPVTEGGAPLRMRMLGQDINAPGDYQTLKEQDGLLRQLSDEKFKSEHPGYFTNYPPAGTANAAMKYSPAEMRKDYLLKAAGVATAGGPGQFEDNEDYTLRVTKIIKLIMDKFKEEDPETFRKKKTVNPFDDEDAEDESYLDAEALEPDTTETKPKKKNRFNVKVK